MFEPNDPVRGKGDEAYWDRQRITLYLLAGHVWRAFKLSCEEYCEWTISHAMLYDDFRQCVKDAIYTRGDENAAEVRKLEKVKLLFDECRYFEGCKFLKVL